MLTTSFLACAAPRLVAPAMNDRMYADAATQANLATLRERGVSVIEPDEGRLASRANTARAACPTPPAPGPDRSGAARRRPALGRDAGPGHGRRHPRADRPGSLPRQPLERSHGLRPRRGRRPRAAGVTLVAANVALPEPAGVRRVDVRPPPSSTPPPGRVPRLPCPADGRGSADFRPPRGPGKITDPGRRWSSPRADRGHPRRPRRLPGSSRRRSSASPPSTGRAAIERARAKLERKGADMIVLNYVSDRSIGFESEGERGHPDRRLLLRSSCRRRCEGRDRRLDPRPGRLP